VDSTAGNYSRESLKVVRELMLIDGQWVHSAEGQFIPVENPSRRGTFVGEVPRGRAEDVDHAVKAAGKAFETWRKVSHGTGQVDAQNW